MTRKGGLHLLDRRLNHRADRCGFAFQLNLARIQARHFQSFLDQVIQAAAFLVDH